MESIFQSIVLSIIQSIVQSIIQSIVQSIIQSIVQLKVASLNLGEVRYYNICIINLINFFPKVIIFLLRSRSGIKKVFERTIFDQLLKLHTLVSSSVPSIFWRWRLLLLYWQTAHYVSIPGRSDDKRCHRCSYYFCTQGLSATCRRQTIFRGIGDQGRAAILDRHNQLRRRVAKGQETGGINAPQPAAANMRKLVDCLGKFKCQY